MPIQDDETRVREAAVTFASRDGLRLAGTFTTPRHDQSSVTVLVHGGGATRDEGGFFTRLAAGMAETGIASLRFDLRGHGASGGRQEDLTLSGVLNDIYAAAAYAQDSAGGEPVNLLGASFGGGICGYFAALNPGMVRRLVLLNPLIDYKTRFVDGKPYWHNGRIDEAAGRELSDNGFLRHSPTFKLGRPLLNEVFYLRPDEAIESIAAPTLFVHGTKDTFVPIESSRQRVDTIRGEAKLLEVDGAQHGFAVHDDPQYLDPQTAVWQAFVIRSVADWLA